MGFAGPMVEMEKKAGAVLCFPWLGVASEDFFAACAGGAQLKSGGVVWSFLDLAYSLLPVQCSERKTKSENPLVKRNFLPVHPSGGNSTVQQVKGWTAPVKAKVTRLPWSHLCN